MKMYFKSLIFALAGALAMTACSNEMEEQLAENGKNGQNVKFSIGVENLSRTAIADGTLVTSFEPMMRLVFLLMMEKNWFLRM